MARTRAFALPLVLLAAAALCLQSAFVAPLGASSAPRGVVLRRAEPISAAVAGAAAAKAAAAAGGAKAAAGVAGGAAAAKGGAGTAAAGAAAAGGAAAASSSKTQTTTPPPKPVETPIVASPDTYILGISALMIVSVAANSKGFFGPW